MDIIKSNVYSLKIEGCKVRESIIFHVDVNSAFLSWEACYRLKELGDEVDLREILSAVGGDIEKRKGVILAKSTAAKTYDVQTGEPIVSALKKCPELTIVKPNFGVYVKYSKAFIAILKEYTPKVEQYSIDEAFMDMTGTEGLHGDMVQLAHTIKDRIYRELGFTVNIGVARNKLLAKMAGDFKKPNLVHTLFPEEIKTKMWPLPVRELFFVGKSTEKKLKLLNIKTIGELAQADPKVLRLHLKKHGELIYQFANGIDNRPVEDVATPNKGYGNSTTIPFDVDSSESAERVLLSLCETVAARLRADHMEASCISVSIVDYEFGHSSKQMTLLKSTCYTQEIYECACQIFEKLWDHHTPIRQLGVHTTKLTDSHIHQMSLFDMNISVTNQQNLKENKKQTTHQIQEKMQTNLEDQLKNKQLEENLIKQDDKAELKLISQLEQERKRQALEKQKKREAEVLQRRYDRQKKLEKLDFAIDTIRQKYGDDSVKRATFLKGNLEHMAGGLGKEKKNGVMKEV